MLFHEIYGSYYQIVSLIIEEAVKKQHIALDDIYRIVGDYGFGESLLHIPDALRIGEWKLLTEDGGTPIQSTPHMPLTAMQKRWLKAILGDRRIGLFLAGEEERKLREQLEEADALYAQDAIVYFDRYADGDPYGDEAYRENFRTILKALHDKRRLKLQFTSQRGKRHTWRAAPQRLEYSAKDDKFRLRIIGRFRPDTINVARISKCELLDAYCASDLKEYSDGEERVVLALVDERNALERAMLHFSNLKKETQRLDDRRYRVTLHYYKEDETEILIRVMSFGPMIKVVSPNSFVAQMRDRLKRQCQWQGVDA